MRVRTIVVTGAASGMGRATGDRLRKQGDRVITIDKQSREDDVDIVADLATAQGRRQAATAALEACANRLDGAVMAAGVGPIRGGEHTLAQVNYFGVVDLLGALRPALAAAGNSKVVVFGSNAATVTPALPGWAVNALLADRPHRLRRLKQLFGRNAAPIFYGVSKLALARWARRTAATPQWAGSGIRLNVIAPGAILTPLLEQQLDGPMGSQVRSLATPLTGVGDPEQIADWVVMMLSPAADFMCGSVVYIDGGTDAYFRADDWPHALPLAGLPGWIRRRQAWIKQSPPS